MTEQVASITRQEQSSVSVSEDKLNPSSALSHKERLRTQSIPSLYGKKTTIRKYALQGIHSSEIAELMNLPPQQVSLYLGTIRNHLRQTSLEGLANAGESNSSIAGCLGIKPPEVIAQLRLAGLYETWKKRNVERNKEKIFKEIPPDTLDKYALEIIRSKLHRFHRGDFFGVPNYTTVGEMAYLFYVYDVLEQRNQHTFRRLKEITGLEKNKVIHYCERSNRPILRERRPKSNIFSKPKEYDEKNTSS